MSTGAPSSVTERCVVILQHQEVVSLGYLAEVLDEVGLEQRVVRVDLEKVLPDPTSYQALVVLGGEMGAYQETEHPFLAAEKTLLARAVGRGTPVLGICLGSQLLADALGGRAYRGPRTEIGYHPVELTVDGREDPVLRHLDGPVLSWHGDTFDVPPEARLLARSPTYPQAYRLGRAVGLQFHPEAPPEMLEEWVALVGHDRIRELGGDPDALVAEARTRAEECGDVGKRVLRAWAEEACDV